LFNQNKERMNNVKNVFSIKDLENLSGIKAHTIRIWEKRYNVLQPMRTDTNIRLYDLASLQKLLNITLLHDFGYKISTISKYPPETIPALVREIVTNKTAKSHAISEFKMAMMNFDQELFFNTYDWLTKEKSFREIFYDVFLPLMNEMGMLWQTDTISPSHEHFITFLIKQKLLIQTEQLQIRKPTKTDKVFVLSLPMNEIHELGLMYLNYEILAKGYKTIYLGESVPIDSLKYLKNHFDSIVFVSYLTVQPDKDNINEYIIEMKQVLESDTNSLWFIGQMVAHIDSAIVSEKMEIFQSIESLVSSI
jgi:DNA-binding transcriptional MerR regulator